MPLSAEERTLRARHAALTRSATEDTRAMTEPARSTFAQSFIEQAWANIGPFQEALVEAHPELPEEALFPMVEAEVLRREVALKKRHYARLGAASAKARRERREKGRAATPDQPAPRNSDSNDTARVGGR